MIHFHSCQKEFKEIGIGQYSRQPIYKEAFAQSSGWMKSRKEEKKKWFFYIPLHKVVYSMEGSIYLLYSCTMTLSNSLIWSKKWSKKRGLSQKRDEMTDKNSSLGWVIFKALCLLGRGTGMTDFLRAKRSYFLAESRPSWRSTGLHSKISTCSERRSWSSGLALVERMRRQQLAHVCVMGLHVANPYSLRFLFLSFLSFSTWPESSSFRLVREIEQELPAEQELASFLACTETKKRRSTRVPWQKTGRCNSRNSLSLLQETGPGSVKQRAAGPLHNIRQLTAEKAVLGQHRHREQKRGKSYDCTWFNSLTRQPPALPHDEKPQNLYLMKCPKWMGCPKGLLPRFTLLMSKEQSERSSNVKELDHILLERALPRTPLIPKNDGHTWARKMISFYRCIGRGACH